MDYAKAANVISLETRRMEEVFPAVNEVEAYWTALKGDALLPRRAQIDPRGIERALHNAFVLERLAPGVARFRLAGMHLADLMGMEVRGMPLTALFTPDARRSAADLLERCFTVPSVVTLILHGERGLGRAALDARMILLPLLDEQGNVTRVLGALQAKGDIGRQPRRFSLVEARVTDIAGLRASGAPAAAQPTPEAAGFAEPPVPPLSGQRPRGRPMLRLVKNDDN